MNIILLVKRSFFLTILLMATGLPVVNAQNKAQTLHQLNNLLVNTVMVDFFSPPVASRIYAYPNIAFFEIIRMEDLSLPSLSGKLNGFNNIPSPPQDVQVDKFIAATFSYCYVAQALVGSEYKFEDWRKAFTDSLFLQSDTVVARNSMAYGRRIADSILSWAKKDNYGPSRGMSRYVISDKTGTWQPTPADYVQALEPNWNTMRPFTLLSPAQFSPKEKLPFSMKKNSVFYKTMMEVYKIGKDLDTNRKAIAKYWDDNPNVSTNLGHLNYFIHKISPGGHWVMIAQQACIKKNESASRSALAYALTSIALYDGFLACWDEKFKTNLVRPITVINQFVDKNWQPYLQTPPFPEFTSGHAVISNAAATVLTGLLGDNFEFIDQTEIPFGNDTRRFPSFNEAAKESSMSRVYAGIHYPETARISIIQGKDIGRHVLNLLYPPATK
ncbi:MAG TPA: vanadium-dependent haloperoxidase [Ferruginibacter sp.]|nr:vanadium-dependent haloperoxidase [Ferruginibacter sp.]